MDIALPCCSDLDAKICKGIVDASCLSAHVVADVPVALETEDLLKYFVALDFVRKQGQQSQKRTRLAVVAPAECHLDVCFAAF